MVSVSSRGPPAEVNTKTLMDSPDRLPLADLLIAAFRKSRRDGEKDMAASIAYFSFFSLFPLLLGIIVVVSFVVDSADLQSRLAALVEDALPGSAAFVRTNVEAVFRLRGAAGLASIIGLWWAARKMFGALSRGINGALGLRRPHGSILSPLRSVLMAAAVASLLLLSAALSTALALLPQLDLMSLLGSDLDTLAARLGSRVASYVFVAALVASIYKLVPFATPTWHDVAPAALIAALLIECGKAVYVFYVDNVAQLEAVYGSVSSVIVLLIWLYFVARVLLFGSEIIAIRQERNHS